MNSRFQVAVLSADLLHNMFHTISINDNSVLQHKLLHYTDEYTI